MAAKAGDVQVGLLDAGRHAGGGATALDVHDDQGHLGHHSPSQSFGLQRNARAGRTGHRHASAPAGTNGHGDGGDFVFALLETAAVLGQFAAQQLHDVGPGSDRIAGTEADARGDEAVGKGFVAAHDHLAQTDILTGVELEKFGRGGQLVIVTRIERIQGRLGDLGVFASETLRQQASELGDIQVEHLGEQTQGENILTLVTAGATDGLDGQGGNGHANMAVLGEVFDRDVLGLHVIGIVNHDAARLERTEVGLVAVIVEGQQHVGLVTGRKHFAGANAHLENGGSAGDRGRDGHEGHDLLLGTACEAGEEAADGLDTVL